MPSISVIIPVYNGMPYIEQCIAGLNRQTLDDFEVVFVDDGSRDQSLVQLERYESERIRVFHQENAGAGSARNTGLRYATGEYVAFLDVDDVYPEKNTLETLFAKAEANHANIIGGSFQSESVQFEPGNKRVFIQEGWIEFSDYQFDFGFQRFLYRKEFLEKHGICFPPYRIFEDPVFLAKAMVAAGRFYAIPDPVYLYSGAHQTDLSCSKVVDYLHGLRDNLILSSENGYAQLHKENYERLNHWGSYYVEGLLPVQKPELFQALMEASIAVDTDLLKQAGVNLPKNYIVPALETIWNACNKYCSIRQIPSSIKKNLVNIFNRFTLGKK